MPPPATTNRERLYRFPSGATLRVLSEELPVLAHFDAEYGTAAASEPGDADIEVYAGAAAIASSPAASAFEHAYRGRHKTARWRVSIGDPREHTMSVAFDGAGQLVISFLQTFYVEPLLRLKFAGRDHALIHAASLIKSDRSVLFPAGSRVGKSTLTLQHAASGHPVQGDNYVILTPRAQTLAFPRRLRVYSDLGSVSPNVYRLLPSRERWRLRVAGLVRRLSLGFANMPRRLTIDQIVGADRTCPEARLDSVFFLTPHGGDALAGPSPLSTDEAIARIQALAEAESARLREALAGGRDAEAAFEDADRQERDVLQRALSGVPSFELRVPRVRDPARIVSEISRVCGLGDAR